MYMNDKTFVSIKKHNWKIMPKVFFVHTFLQIYNVKKTIDEFQELIVRFQ